MSKLTRRGFLRGGLLSTAAGGIAARAHAEETTAKAESGAIEVSCSVNGAAHTLEVGVDTAALTVIREKLGLKGTKHGCGHGACGACTVLVGDSPQVSCLLPATALHGQDITTVEGIAGEGTGAEALHPVQRAFMAEDALQCGYCTPGFIVEASAFHDSWRATNEGEEPSVDQVKEALAGHLCRCGAYASIIQAVQRACSGLYDEGEVAPDRVDAQAKVTGAALFTVDVALEGTLEGRFLRSPHAHAVLRSFDDSKALALDGVKAVVRFVKDGRKVRFAGQEVAAVAAVDAETAAQALGLIQVEYELLEPVFALSESIAKDAPELYPRRRGDAPNSAEGPLPPAAWSGNLRGPTDSSIGAWPMRAQRFISEPPSDAFVIEERYKTQVKCHTALEPHAAVARWTGKKSVEVWASTQSVSHIADDIAERFKLKRKNVRVRVDHVGGGFGGKALLQLETVAAVELARVAGAPVRVVLTRAEELTTGGTRPGLDVELALGVDSKGELKALQSRAFSQGGVSVGSNTGLLMRLMYPQGDKSVQDFDVVTNGPPGRPWRAPGGPPAYFALEQAVDAMAFRVGLDPVALRRRWDPNVNRSRLYDWVEMLPAWRSRPRHRSDTGRFRRGLGFASGAWPVILEPTTQVQLDAGPDGLVLSTASQDIGNGTRSTLAWALSRELGVPPGSIEVRIGDSDLVHGPMTGGSRTTLSVAPVVADLAEQLKRSLEDVALDQLGLFEPRIVDGVLEHADGEMPLVELLKVAPPSTFLAKRGRDPIGRVLPVSVEDTNALKLVSASVQLTRVQVDTRLGKVRVLESWSGLAVGRILSPRLARSQVEGAVVQSLGYSLYEERRQDPSTGRLLSAGLEDYRLTGIGDVPPLHVHFDQDGYEEVLGRSVGLGELAMMAPPASIANAVFNATGWRPTELPIRPDRVLKGLS